MFELLMTTPDPENAATPHNPLPMPRVPVGSSPMKSCAIVTRFVVAEIEMPLYGKLWMARPLTVKVCAAAPGHDE